MPQFKVKSAVTLTLTQGQLNLTLGEMRYICYHGIDMRYVGLHAPEISQCTHTHRHTHIHMYTHFPLLTTVYYNVVGQHFIIFTSLKCQLLISVLSGMYMKHVCLVNNMDIHFRMYTMLYIHLTEQVHFIPIHSKTFY